MILSTRRVNSVLEQYGDHATRRRDSLRGEEGRKGRAALFNRLTGFEGESRMATTFRSYEPDQMLLLAPDMRDWLPEGHFAHHVSHLVDGLDLTAYYAPYEGDGLNRPAHGER